ncbi:MAG: MutH/Sau3AI family endonuclease [Methylophilaceae bacterium]
MINTIIDALHSLEGKKLKDLPEANNFSLKNKSFSRIVLDNYLSNILKKESESKIDITKLLLTENIVIRTVPISHASYNPIESTRISTISLKYLDEEEWDDSLVKAFTNGVIFVPFLVKNKNLGQPYREFGKAFLWKANFEDIIGFKTEWKLFKDAVAKGLTPNSRKSNNSVNNFPTEADTKYIHMRPHSTKDKFELDKFGNKVRKMAFMLNKGYLRKIFIENKI